MMLIVMDKIRFSLNFHYHHVIFLFDDEREKEKKKYELSDDDDSLTLIDFTQQENSAEEQNCRYRNR